MIFFFGGGQGRGERGWGFCSGGLVGVVVFFWPGGGGGGGDSFDQVTLGWFLFSPFFVQLYFVWGGGEVFF